MIKRLWPSLAALAALLWLTFPAIAVVDNAICSTADAGATCTGAETISSSNEELVDLRKTVPMVLGSVSGTNTITATTSPAATSLLDGQLVMLKPAADNTGAVTLNRDSLGAKDVVSLGGAALVSGDLKSTSIYLLRYYSTGNQYRVLTPLGSGGTVGLSQGGTGSALTDPGADRLMFWDDSAGAVDWLTLGSAYGTSTTTLQNPIEAFCVAASDETTAITTGTAKVTFRMPYAFTLTAIRGSLNTVSSSGNPAFDVNEAGVSVFSTTLTIDASEKTSTTAATAAVISDTSLADDAEMTIDIDTAGTGAKGAKICLIGRHT